MTDGIILNSKELCNSQNVLTLEEYILKELDSGNLQFYKSFRGSFSGAFYIKKQNKLYAYVDHIGDRPVFIYKNNDNYVCTSAFPAIVGTLKLNNEKVVLNEDEIIDMIDTKFRNAVRMEYEKDIEYGYKHLSSLSGGLDARMSLWAARDLGYDHIQTCTFSQSGYLDEKIAEKNGSLLITGIIIMMI